MHTWTCFSWILSRFFSGTLRTVAHNWHILQAVIYSSVSRHIRGPHHLDLSCEYSPVCLIHQLTADWRTSRYLYSGYLTLILCLSHWMAMINGWLFFFTWETVQITLWRTLASSPKSKCASCKGTRAVKLFSNKILQFLTGDANAGCPV